MATSRFDKQAAKDSRDSTLANPIHSNASTPDLRVICGGREWLCHKLILCKQSEWFHKACSGNFKERNSNVIALEEDHEDAIAAMLMYCYCLDYPFPEAESHLAPVTFHVRVFAAAEKYFVAGLQKLAANYVADAVAADGLRDDSLAEALTDAYTTTSDPDRMLRDTLIGYIIENRQDSIRADSGAFAQALNTVPALGADIARALLPSPQAKPRTQKYRCPCWKRTLDRCSVTFEASMNDTVMFSHVCQADGVVYTEEKSWWDKHRTWYPRN